MEHAHFLCQRNSQRISLYIVDTTNRELPALENSRINQVFTKKLNMQERKVLKTGRGHTGT